MRAAHNGGFMAGPRDFDNQVIAEFRENAGKVGGRFEGSAVLLLHSKGAKSGAERITPLVYTTREKDLVIFASKAGSDTNPAWYHNLVANPQTSVEVGTETVSVKARVAESTERSAIWEPWKTQVPQFAEYEASTSRQIPVVILERS